MAHQGLGRLIDAPPFQVQVSTDPDTNGYWAVVVLPDGAQRTVSLDELELLPGAGVSSRPCWLNERGEGLLVSTSEHALLALTCRGFAGDRILPSVPSHAPKAKPKVTADFWLRLYASTLSAICLETLTALSGMSRSTVHSFLTRELESGHLRRTTTRPGGQLDLFPRSRLHAITDLGMAAWLQDIHSLWPRYHAGTWPKRHQPPVTDLTVKRLERSLFATPKLPDWDETEDTELSYAGWTPTGSDLLKRVGMLRYPGIAHLYVTTGAWSQWKHAGYIQPLTHTDVGPTTRCTVVTGDAHLMQLFRATQHACWSLQVDGTAHRIPAKPGVIQALSLVDATLDPDPRSQQAAESAWADYTRPYRHD